MKYKLYLPTIHSLIKKKYKHIWCIVCYIYFNLKYQGFQLDEKGQYRNHFSLGTTEIIWRFTFAVDKKRQKHLIKVVNSYLYYVYVIKEIICINICNRLVSRKNICKKQYVYQIEEILYVYIYTDKLTNPP